MHFLLASIPEKLIVQHHVLPSNCFVQLKLNLIHLMTGLHMNEEVSMVKDSVYQQIRAVFNIVNSSCGRLDKHILCDSSFALFEQDPAMNPFA